MRSKLTHSSAKENCRCTNLCKYLITFTIKKVSSLCFSSCKNTTESYEVSLWSCEQVYVLSVHILAVKYSQFGLALHTGELILVSAAAVSDQVGVWNESLALHSPASPSGQQGDISTLLITSTCIHTCCDTQRGQQAETHWSFQFHHPRRTIGCLHCLYSVKMPSVDKDAANHTHTRTLSKHSNIFWGSFFLSVGANNRPAWFPQLLWQPPVRGAVTPASDFFSGRLSE